MRHVGVARIFDVRTGYSLDTVREADDSKVKALRATAYATAGWILSKSDRVPSWGAWSRDSSRALSVYMESTLRPPPPSSERGEAPGVGRPRPGARERRPAGRRGTPRRRAAGGPGASASQRCADRSRRARARQRRLARRGARALRASCTRASPLPGRALPRRGRSEHPDLQTRPVLVEHLHRNARIGRLRSATARPRAGSRDGTSISTRLRAASSPPPIPTTVAIPAKQSTTGPGPPPRSRSPISRTWTTRTPCSPFS